MAALFEECHEFSACSSVESWRDTQVLGLLGDDFSVCALVTGGHVGDGVCRGNGAAGAPTP